jgi:hypothetical protein
MYDFYYNLCSLLCCSSCFYKLRLLWPLEWVPVLHGRCCVEAPTQHLPMPLARTTLGAHQMTFDMRI